MNTGVISKRYAKALLAYATEQGTEDAIYVNMQQLLHTLQHVKEFVEALVNPLVTAKERIALLCAAVDSSPVYNSFVHLVVKEEREPLLIFIAHSYLSLYRQTKNIKAVGLTTAVPASRELIAKIATFAKSDGSNVELHNTIDHSIIGGFIYETDSHRLDASIQRQLRDIEEQLIEKNKKLV